MNRREAKKLIRRVKDIVAELQKSVEILETLAAPADKCIGGSRDEIADARIAADDEATFCLIRADAAIEAILTGD
jgi:hypothetical protein